MHHDIGLAFPCRSVHIIPANQRSAEDLRLQRALKKQKTVQSVLVQMEENQSSYVDVEVNDP